MTDNEMGFRQGWAILELMGHKTLAGWVTAVDFAGAAAFRIDVPGDEDGDKATQFYDRTAMYCLTPVDESTARRVAKTTLMAPVTRWSIESAERRAAAIEAGESAEGQAGLVRARGDYVADDYCEDDEAPI